MCQGRPTLQKLFLKLKEHLTLKSNSSCVNKSSQKQYQISTNFLLQFYDHLRLESVQKIFSHKFQASHILYLQIESFFILPNRILSVSDRKKFIIGCMYVYDLYKKMNGLLLVYDHLSRVTKTL